MATHSDPMTMILGFDENEMPMKTHHQTDIRHRERDKRNHVFNTHFVCNEGFALLAGVWRCGRRGLGGSVVVVGVPNIVS